VLRRVSFKPIPPLEWPGDLPQTAPPPVIDELSPPPIEEDDANHQTPTNSVQDQAATMPVRLNQSAPDGPPGEPNASDGLDQAQAVAIESEPRPEPQPTAASTPLLRGNQHLKQNEYDQAIAAYAEASRLDPDDPRPWINQGSAYYHIDDFVQAAASLTEAIRLNPHDAVAWNNRGLAYRGLGEFQKAVADYSEAVRLQPNDPVVRYNRGLAYTFLDNHTLAVADFDEAIRLRPNYSQARQARESSLARQAQGRSTTQAAFAPKSRRSKDF
jgi:tetratricopeptide (TPR) repeat protein